MSRFLWIAGSCTFLGGLVFVSRGSSSPGAGPRVAAPVVLASVEVLTDRLDPIQGAIVQLESSVAVTGSEGQTSWLSVDASGGASLVLVEKTVQSGIALGMIEAEIVSPLPDPTGDYQFVVVSRTQPVAVPVQVQGLPAQMNNHFPPEGDYPHWRVAVPSGSNLRFTLHAAPLLDEEAIEQYSAYRGASLDQEYVRGAALVVPNVQLGNKGLVIGIALLGDLSGGAVVDAYNFTTSNAALAGPPLSIHAADTHNDVVYVHLKGGLRKGHLGLFVRASGDPAEVTVQPDSPPEVVVPSDGLGVDSACLGCGAEEDMGSSAMARDPLVGPILVTDCEPETPIQPPEWSCDPTPPSGGHCGPATPGAKQCKTIRSRTPRICRSADSEVKGEKYETAAWKATFEMKGATGTPLASGGGFEYGRKSTTVVTDTWTADSGGEGLGECMRYFRFELVCLQAFTIMADACLAMSDGFTTWSDCIVPLTVYETCHDSASSQSECYRTP